jgi:hypothetical protein
MSVQYDYPKTSSVAPVKRYFDSLKGAGFFNNANVREQLAVQIMGHLVKAIGVPPCILSHAAEVTSMLSVP